MRSGRIGLRSLATGAAWRNVQVEPAKKADLVALAGPSPRVLHPDFPKSEAAFNATHNFPTFDDPDLRRRFFSEPGPQARRSRRSHSVSELVRGRQTTIVTIRGTVSLTSPMLFVQDDTRRNRAARSDCTRIESGR